MKTNFWGITLTLLLLSWAIAPLPALASTGADDEKTDWEISTVAELYAFAEYVNAGNTGANAKLMNDIVVNGGTAFSDNNYTLKTGELTPWTPISSFAGTFDGQGHTISGLYCDNSNGSAGFIQNQNGGAVQNLGIINSYFRGHNTVGGIAARITGNSVVSSCWIKDCHLLAYCDQTSIETPEVNLNLGGITGRISGIGGDFNPSIPSLYRCYFIGKLTGGEGKNIDFASIGGIAGEADETLNNCYAIASISLSDIAKHASYTGQLVGRARTLTPYPNCYTKEAPMLGNEAEIKEYYPSFEEPEGSIRTEAEFASGLVAYLLNGSESGKTDGWRQRIDGEAGQKDTYPVLQATENNIVYYRPVTDSYSNLLVEFRDNWEIRTTQDLYDFAECANAYPASNISATLMEDIVVNGGTVFSDNNYTLKTSELTPWTPISSFAGTFDGQGHTISGLYCDYSNGSAGFILSTSAKIQNLGIKNSYFCGKDYVGGIAASTSSDITSCWVEDCHLEASLKNTEDKIYFGGIAGFSGSIKNCLFKGELYCENTGADNVSIGGIAGYSNNTVNNCLSFPTISVSDNEHSKTRIGYIVGWSQRTHGDPYARCYTLKTEGQDPKLCGGVGFLVDNATQPFNNLAGSVRTQAEFESGLVTYLLNSEVSGKTDGWRQRLEGAETDAFPVLQATANNIVYKHLDSHGVVSYNNSYSEVVLVTDWEIRTVEDLYAYAECVNTYPSSNINAKLMNDIVVNEQVFKDNNYTLVDNASTTLAKWAPINGSIGTFDGQGHTISGLYFDESPATNTQTGYFGFFGRLDAGTVTNLGIVNSYFCGYMYVGGFVGYVGDVVNNRVSITNCWGIGNYLVGRRHNSLYVGGIAGWYNCSKKITNCGFVGRLHDLGVSSRIEAGGIVGVTHSQIVNCYSDVYTALSSPSTCHPGRLIGSIDDAKIDPFVNSYATKQGEAAQFSRLCYYRYYTYNNPAGSVRTKEEFASGLVAYLLNNSESGKTDRWRQRIDGEDNQKDAYPVMASYATNNIVYACTDECPTETLVLSNSEVQPKTHNYQVDNTTSTKVSVPLYEMHCTNDGCGKEKPNTLVVKQCDGTNNLELVYETVSTSPDDRNAYPITIDQKATSCVFRTANDDFTINSANPYYSPVDFLVPGTLTFKRAFVTNTGYYTMFVPFKLPADVNTQLGSFFGCSGLKPSGDDYNLEYTTISKPDAGDDIPAHTGCLFYPSKTFDEITTTANIVKASTAISDPSTTAGKNNNTMYGTYALTSIPKHVFGYYEKNGKSIFALSGDGARLMQFRAYLYISSSASSKEYEVVFLDNELSSIHENTILSTETDTPIYDLHGNIVLTPQRGNIYIRKGKPFRM